jgi:hypothetical protein
MKTLAFPALMLSLGLGQAALADVTLEQTTSGAGLGLSGTAPSTTYIKGSKMRTTATVGKAVRTTIFDLDAQKMYSFDDKKKEADAWNMAELGDRIATAVNVAEMKASLKPNGQTKEIAGRKADGYDLLVSVPATMGGSMQVTVTLEGPMWIVKGAPGANDVLRFYKSAVDKGWIFTDPRVARAQPGQAKAMAEMYRQIVQAGGIVYEQAFSIKMSGEGPLAAALARVGGVTTTVQVVSVKTEALSDDLFAPPADYKLNERK